MRLLSFCLAMLFVAATHAAAINVSYITLNEVSGYEAERVYAGEVVASRASSLGFKLSGRVATVLVDIGQVVAKDQPLAALDHAELRANVRNAEASVALARANAGALEAEVLLASNTEKRFRRLREEGHAAKQTYDEVYLNLRVKRSQLDVARAQLTGAVAARDGIKVTLAEATLYAPFDGTIQTRYVDEGSQVNPGQSVLRIVELGKLEAHVGVPGTVGARLRPNNTYRLRANGQEHSARLSSVLPEIDPTTRTQTAVLLFPAGEENAIPLGSTIELALNELIEEVGFWLPLAALTQSDRGLWGVYVIEEDDSVSRRLVEVIHTEAGRVFVRGTLAPGDQVVDTGVHRIVPGQQVSATESRATLSAR